MVDLSNDLLGAAAAAVPAWLYLQSAVRAVCETALVAGVLRRCRLGYRPQDQRSSRAITEPRCRCDASSYRGAKRSPSTFWIRLALSDAEFRDTQVQLRRSSFSQGRQIRRRRPQVKREGTSAFVARIAIRLFAGATGCRLAGRREDFGDARSAKSRRMASAQCRPRLYRRLTDVRPPAGVPPRKPGSAGNAVVVPGAAGAAAWSALGRDAVAQFGRVQPPRQARPSPAPAETRRVVYSSRSLSLRTPGASDVPARRARRAGPSAHLPSASRWVCRAEPLSLGLESASRGTRRDRPSRPAAA